VRSRTAALALAVGATFAWVIAGLGPASTVIAQTTTSDTGTGIVTRTETKTLTEPARTDTVTETATATAPADTTNRTLNVTTPDTTSGESSSGGLEWWGWALIGLGAVVIGLVMFMVGRGRSKPPSGPSGAPPPPGPPPSAGAPGY
jgi:hypothetical protein